MQVTDKRAINLLDSLSIGALRIGGRYCLLMSAECIRMALTGEVEFTGVRGNDFPNAVL